MTEIIIILAAAKTKIFSNIIPNKGQYFLVSNDPKTLTAKGVVTERRIWPAKC